MIWLGLLGGPHYETSSLMKQWRILGLARRFVETAIMSMTRR